MRALITALLLLGPCSAAYGQIAPRAPSGPERIPGAIIDVQVRFDQQAAGRELGETRKRIKRGRDSGDLSKQEARALRKEADQIGTLAERYGRDGISDSERRELDMRSRALGGLTEARRAQGGNKVP
ncbi:hypothetical protein [Sphingomonas sp. MM-1]|uniref:hypothetical protein n=1 Tax=Sphingomonas sp. MM-1 TaxID=745310 RepID=UPI0011837F20|nr:hypothetical protein [Sphingomonas sp. MM-1]